MPKKQGSGSGEKKLSTRRGKAGMPTVTAKSTALALSPPMPKAALDARQANIGVRRKASGPAKRQASAPKAAAKAAAMKTAPSVPPTECAEVPKGNRQ